MKFPVATGVLRGRIRLHAERRFFLYLLLIQLLVIASLFLAVTSSKTLDTLTSEKMVRGVEVEAPVDRATGWVL